MDEEPTPDPLPAEPVPLPIDGVLDLHAFRPQQIKELVLDYLAACQERGILEVRIIHGKGIGALKRTVHALLSRHPEVITFHLDHEQFSGAGATLVRLRPPSARHGSATTPTDGPGTSTAGQTAGRDERPVPSRQKSRSRSGPHKTR